MKSLHHGSCHCGAVRFECEADLAPPGERSEPELPGIWWTSTFRCNCSFCTKTRFWKVFVRARDFRLIGGGDALADYQHGEKHIHHFFCRHCGARPFSSADFEPLGGPFYAVNVACLDGLTPDELARIPITYEDGRHDDWPAVPKVTAYL